ncbi:MAG: tetratricopeptide repeat protein [Candidatus Limnocylindrales bacterium]
MIEALLQAERLMVYGMLDDAERIYSGAIEQDPLNAIAVVGLARVALERGDDQLAYARARRALEIDPQNSAAIRLEQRLADVFAARAEANAPAAPAAPSQDPLAPRDDVRPSEQAVFTRNPSMAEHQRMEQMREGAAVHIDPPQAEERRPGLLRRLLGD